MAHIAIRAFHHTQSHRQLLIMISEKISTLANCHSIGLCRCFVSSFTLSSTSSPQVDMESISQTLNFVHFRRSWDIKGSAINTFATFWVLLFTKVVSTSVNLMQLVFIVNNNCDDKSWSKLYYDASCGIFQPCHYPYTSLTLAVSITLIVLLYLYFSSSFQLQWCRNFQCRLFQVANEVAKIFQHSFKDGTENTLDCQWFAGTYHLIRMVIATSVNWRTPQQIRQLHPHGMELNQHNALFYNFLCSQ